jgi:hypothetical protein
VNKYIKLITYSAAGAALGYGYYYFIGCTSGGGCPLTSHWYVTTIYGMFMGIVMAFPLKKGSKDILLNKSEGNTEK